MKRNTRKLWATWAPIPAETKTRQRQPALREGGLGFKEAKVSFVCRKIYQHMFTKEDLAPDIQEYYKGRPQAFPLNEKGEWEPHIVFVGEIKTVTGNE